MILLLLYIHTLYAAVEDKSAIVYYGDDISYTTLGIHDYIILQPNHVNTDVPGFKIYKKKIYAYVSIGEIERSLPEYRFIKKEWIATKNKNWNSIVLDIKNKEYQEFLFQKMIEPLLKKGFENFFFDTLDSYQLYSKNQQERAENEKALADFINEFHKRYPASKLVVNRGFEIIDKIHNSIEAVLFESYYKGLSGNPKQPYKDVSKKDRKWFKLWLKKIRSYKKDIISVEYMSLKDIYNSRKPQKVIKKLKKRGMIPYISNKNLNIYGLSSKNAVKREIFTLVNEINYDRTDQSSHRNGALILEYLGYKQKLYRVDRPLPDPRYMKHYAGVVIWLQDYTTQPKKLLQWIKQLVKNNIKVVFVNSFGFVLKKDEYKFLGISIQKTFAHKIGIKRQSPLVGFEIDPPLYSLSRQINITESQPLLEYLYTDNTTSTPVALTPWGGYMVDDGVMVNIDDENLWITNPFAFFAQALDLEPLPVADVTTQNGKRILFTHVDGDGLANRVEGDFGYYSGDVILNKILKKYPIPHSVSIIGSDIDENGPFYKVRKDLIQIAKEMYALENVEGATHTYSHPFFWDKIKNDNLSPMYRLKIKGYRFSLKHELLDTLVEINKELYPKDKMPKAKTVFWSGDCAPRVNALSFIYQHDLLAINGGDTTITKTYPWLTRIAPLGVEREGYAQIYTGAQNENVFTNDWLGPFWGFKNVVQTFEMTNSPRRFKPIDIYYHLYSGSKQASIEALTDVFNWVMQQDTFPIFTSEYIPKVIEFYNYSLAKDDEGNWLFSGLNTLKTIRIEKRNFMIDFDKNPSIAGVAHFENHTYLSLAPDDKYILHLEQLRKAKPQTYMIDANGYLQSYSDVNGVKNYTFKGYVPLKLSFHLPTRCQVNAIPEATSKMRDDESVFLEYEKETQAKVTLQCL